MNARLALEDGGIFSGNAFGATGTVSGEVVFNTSMTGYQEILTDPSYYGQIVTMTFPMIGNYGINPDDWESNHTRLSGMVIKEMPARPSNYRSRSSLCDFMISKGIIGLTGVDTRALTRRVRIHGALRGVLSTEIGDPLELVRMALSCNAMAGANLVSHVVPTSNSEWTEPLSDFAGSHEQNASPTADCRIVVIDCGAKHSILRHLASAGCQITVVPTTRSAAEIKDLAPNGVVVSNGPGDPAAVGKTVETLRKLLGAIPLLGICLGHQMLALAIGAQTYKLKFGHHGANVPAMNHCTEKVEITSQNHGFAVDATSLQQNGGRVTHTNLNDQSLEGFIHSDHQVAAVQFHPEAAPGPHDSNRLFDKFVKLVRSKKAITEESLYN